MKLREKPHCKQGIVHFHVCWSGVTSIRECWNCLHISTRVPSRVSQDPPGNQHGPLEEIIDLLHHRMERRLLRKGQTLLLTVAAVQFVTGSVGFNETSKIEKTLLLLRYKLFLDHLDIYIYNETSKITNNRFCQQRANPLDRTSF